MPFAPSLAEALAAACFALAVMHTFSTKAFAHLAHRQPAHAGLWHLLGEVEVVFGLWAFILVVFWFAFARGQNVLAYLEGRDFTEPLFVFVIMVIAASRPILQLLLGGVLHIARLLPVRESVATYFLCLAALPLLGSFITEPAAMTVAALLLRDRYFRHRLSTRLQYATVGTLFVNISIGGTLTSFAAPPVLMIAKQWGWDSLYMLSHFGWRAAVAVMVNAALVTWLFQHEIAAKGATDGDTQVKPVPVGVVSVHVMFLAAVVLFAHYAVVFMGLFLFFLGYAEAYRRHQDRLYLREGLLVAFFLAGLVTLGGMQKWWLQPLLTGVDPTVLYFVTTGLTAITDNAALTYLGAQVEGLTPEFKYALVAGAVSGGGLTVIANAPNPAGFAILKGSFRDDAISPLALLVAALPPTLVTVVAFQVA